MRLMCGRVLATNVNLIKLWPFFFFLLQSTLCRTSSLETKIRNITKEAIKELKNSGTVCACGRPMAMDSGCRKCLMSEVCGRLRNQGLNSAICKSKWKSSPYIPSGTYIITFFYIYIYITYMAKEIKNICDLSL